MSYEHEIEPQRRTLNKPTQVESDIVFLKSQYRKLDEAYNQLVEKMNVLERNQTRLSETFRLVREHYEKK